MNICIICSRYPYQGNMVHVFVKKLVDEWAKSGNRCVVIAPMSRTKLLLHKEIYAPEYERQDVGKEAFVEVYRPRFLSIPKLVVGGVSISSLLEQRVIEKTLDSLRFPIDAIYGHFFIAATKGWRYVRKHNIPLFAATGESVFEKWKNPCWEFSFDKFRTNLTGCVCVSSHNLRIASELGYIDSQKAKVFPNGANISLFRKMDKYECRNRLGLPQDCFIVICVGQFIKRKGQKRILMALDMLNNPQIKTIFLGKGEDQLEHESILYKGMAPNEVLPIYLNASDVFVLPTQNEGCCNAIIEALACGLPIISSDRPFNHDVLNESNSILINPDSIEDIANSIQLLYNNEEKRILLGANAIRCAQALSITARSSNIMNFIVEQIEKEK